MLRRLDVTVAGDVTVVRLRDRTLDESNCEAVRAELFALIGPRLHLDLRSVAYLTSAALALLVSLRRRVQEAGGELTLGGAQPFVEEIFAVTGLARLFGLPGPAAGPPQDGWYNPLSAR